MATFKTIEGPSEGLYKEKGSKFIALAFPVSTEEAIEVILKDLRGQYHDASHHCYACILGSKDQTFRVNDDGEPSHSAGDPILRQIRAFELTNVLVVVVRYFGGTKLGVGGLVSAYKAAARSTLEQVKIVTRHSTCGFTITFPYELTGEMESIFNDFDLVFGDRHFKEKCTFKGLVREDDLERFSSRLSGVYGIRYSLERLPAG